MIEKPHSFRTACTIATQIVAQVASGQFGGQTITLSHLAPFVRISEEKIRKEVEEAFGIKLVESTTTFGTRIGVVTGCHTGPTALGLAFMPKHNKVII